MRSVASVSRSLRPQERLGTPGGLVGWLRVTQIRVSGANRRHDRGRVGQAGEGMNVEHDKARVIDYGADGSVVGVEFISPSQGIDLAGVPCAADVKREARRIGLRVRVPSSG